MFALNRIFPQGKKSSHISWFSPTSLITLTSCVFSYSLIAISPFTLAQEYPGCFMKDRAGKVINLNPQLCQQNITAPKASSSPSTSKDKGVYRAKILRRMENIPVIEVTFNGNQKWDMMVDSGASGTVITPAMAKALAVVTKGTVRASTPNGIAEFPLARVTSIEAGGLVIKDVQVMISPSLEVGLLGHDFFGKKDMSMTEDMIEFRDRS
jgi:aspartyl protease family protein